MALLRHHRLAAAWILSVAASATTSPALAQASAEQQAKTATAEELVQRTAEFYSGLEKFSVDLTYEMSFAMAGQERQTYTDKRRVTVWRPNRLAVRPLGESDAEGEFVSDGTLLFASMPSMGRYVLLPAEQDIDALLEHDDSIAMGVAQIAVQLAGSKPLGDFADAEVEYKRLEAQEIDGVKCDGVEMSAEGGGFILWIEQGDHPIVRKYEWRMPQSEDADTLGVEMAAPVVSFSNWQIDPDLALEAFAYDIPEGLEPATSLMEGYMDELELELEMEEDAEDDEWPDPTGRIPQNENAITTREVAEQKLAYNRRTLVDAYREHGKHDPKWDDQAVELLEEMARHFSSTPGYKSHEEIIAMAEPVLAAGCDDPLVKYCYAALLQDSDDSPQAQQKAAELLQESYAGLKELDYPANRRLAAAKRVWIVLNKQKVDKKRLVEAWDNYLDEFADTIAMEVSEPEEIRQLHGAIVSACEHWGIEQYERLYKRVKPLESEHSFLVNMIGGAFHKTAAWEARGNRWASRVSEDGWQGFAEHMSEARICYEKAAEESDQPNATTAMISLAMASSDSPASEMRHWFDRTVEMQFDYLPAYQALLYGYLPRWHGNYSLMYQFGLECKNTERYDTSVPYVFCDALWRIANDSQNPSGIRSLNRPGLYENTHEVCGRYIQYYTDVSKDPDRVDWWGTVDFGFAYCTEHWNEAADILDQTGDVLNDDALSRFPLSAEQAIAEVRLRTSPRADELMPLLADRNQSSPQQHIRQLQELLGDESLHSSIRGRVRSQLQQLRWQSAFESGEAVSLAADDKLAGWEVVAGAWQSNSSGGLDGVSQARGVILRCEAQFGSEWELTGKWRYGKSPYAKWDAGVILFGGDTPLHSIMLNPTQGWAAAGPHQNLGDHHHPVKVSGKEVSFRLRVDNGVVAFWVDGEQIINNESLSGWQTDQSIRLAIGANYNWAGAELSFEELVISPLDERMTGTAEAED